MDMKGVLSLLLFSFILSSCDKEKSVTAIYLEPNEVTVNAGAEFQFVVITEPSDALSRIVNGAYLHKIKVRKYRIRDCLNQLTPVLLL